MRVLIGFLAAALSACASAPREVVLDTAQSSVHYRIGESEPRDWGLNPALNPDVLEAPIPAGARRDVCFLSENDEVCFEIAVGESRDFVIVREGVRHNTRVLGVLDVPAAVFSEAYQAEHRGRTVILVPEVYELINIAIALTPFASENPGLVVSDTAYHADVQAHFAAMHDHPLVRALDAEMRTDIFVYFRSKMNGYAFEFDAAGRVVRSPIYDRTSFDGDRTNTLLPHVEAMQSFADQSRFREFYTAHRGFYEGQIAYLRDSADTGGITRWLQGNFPGVRAYDGVKIIFSPLVGSNQSLTTFDYNGYRELQPHVNYPYRGTPGLSPQAEAISRSNILFTEMNHGFIGEPSERMAAEIDAAIGARAPWADDTMAARTYSSDLALFNEYMNWGLVSLYHHDVMSEADWRVSRAAVERMMVERRGFKKFVAFNAMLIDLYANRGPNRTLADLYPEIVTWFAAQSAIAPPS